MNEPEATDQITRKTPPRGEFHVTVVLSLKGEGEGLDRAAAVAALHEVLPTIELITTPETYLEIEAVHEAKGGSCVR
jgi:hypothetical protein